MWVCFILKSITSSYLNQFFSYQKSFLILDFGRSKTFHLLELKASIKYEIECFVELKFGEIRLIHLINVA